MRAENEKSVTDELLAELRPIEFLTENGFSIVRAWEIDRLSPPTSRTFTFIARHERGEDQEIIVEIADDALEQLAIRIRCRILLCSSFWICCAERHLATYLWEKDACPPSNKLVVQHLDPEEVILAARWGRKPAPEQGQD